MEHFELINMHILFFGGSNNHSVSYQIIDCHKHNNKSTEQQWHPLQRSISLDVAILKGEQLLKFKPLPSCKGAVTFVMMCM